MKPLISVIIVTHNRNAILRTTLEQVQRLADASVEIIVVDNCSTDGTKDMLKVAFPGVRVLVLAENMGAIAWNHGAQVATGTFILILDDDCVLSLEGIRHLAKISNELKVDVVFGRVWNEMAGSGRDARFTLETLALFPGCAVLVRASSYQRLNGYSPNIFLFHNELEFTLRGLEDGMRFGFVPHVISHHNSDAIGTLTPLRAVHGSASLVLIVLQLFSGWNRVRALFIVVLNRVWITLRSPRYVFHFARGILNGIRRSHGLKRKPVHNRIQETYLREFIDFYPYVLLSLRKRLFGHTLDQIVGFRTTLYPRKPFDYTCAVLQFRDGQLMLEYH